MAKSTFFTGQPVFGQLIKYLDRDEIIKISRESGGERYVKKFDMWTHLLVMLYAVIMRFDSLREIEASALAYVNRLPHLKMGSISRRSTLAEANGRRKEALFGRIYFDLLNAHRGELLADSRSPGRPRWLGKLKIIDSTTVTLFSNLIFKGVGRDPKLGRKKGGVKVHTIINANEGVPGDIKFTSAATHDSFMLVPTDFDCGDILAMDRAYIDYEKMEELNRRGVTYVTKMKKNLAYEVLEEHELLDDGKYRKRTVKTVLFRKGDVSHKARIVTYTETKKSKRGVKEQTVSLLTNSIDLDVDEVVAIYLRRWQIESLFKQIKQNFPLRYFYGESENAIKIQIWVTLIANLLMTLAQRRLHRHWSFSGLATMMRIILMHYIDMIEFFEHPERDWKMMLENAAGTPP